MPDIIKFEYGCEASESESCNSGSDFWEGIIRLTEESADRKRRDGEQNCFFEEFRFINLWQKHVFYNDYSFENAAVLGQAADNGIRLTYLKEERADINFNVTLSEHCSSQLIATDKKTLIFFSTKWHFFYPDFRIRIQATSSSSSFATFQFCGQAVFKSIRNRVWLGLAWIFVRLRRFVQCFNRTNNSRDARRLYSRRIYFYKL